MGTCPTNQSRAWAPGTFAEFLTSLAGLAAIAGCGSGGERDGADEAAPRTIQQDTAPPEQNPSDVEEALSFERTIEYQWGRIDSSTVRVTVSLPTVPRLCIANITGGFSVTGYAEPSTWPNYRDNWSRLE